jgi:hypothetical protein
MKSSLSKIIMIGAATLIAAGCSNDKDEDKYTQFVDYDLSSTHGEWVAGFADYPVDGEAEWELTATENSDFSTASGDQHKGYMLSSVNRSDDTQMYISTKVSGLKPSTFYDATFNVQLATNVNDQCVGIGGAPHAVTVKAAMSHNEPEVIVDEIDHYRLTMDVGNQTQGGLDGQVLGNIGLPTLEDCDPASSIYGLKDLDNAGVPFEAWSDEDGALWLTLLTDSGFEGPTKIYFTSVFVAFKESAKKAAGFSVELDFSEAQPNLETVFYDYPTGREAEWELTAEEQVTVELEQGGEVTGFLLHSYNRSDDTGMLLNVPIKGLEANARYSAVFKTTIATNVNNLCFGIGGAPHAVTVKAGLSGDKPLAVTVAGDDHYRINIDLGNNMQEGENGLVLGDIGADNLNDCDPSSELFELKAFDSELLEKEFIIDTDDKGVLYFSLATDSGFEGPTTILFTQGSVSFYKVPT